MATEQFMPLIHPPDEGDTESRQQLFTLLYDELRRLAQRELKRRGSWLTLGATTLLHEVYISMQKREGVRFPDRARFFSYASHAMRGLIINYARSGQAFKRGGAFEITSLPTNIPEHAADSTELQRLSDAIELLAVAEPRLAQVVDLKYFSGFSLVDIAAMWGVSKRTVQRDWEKARIFLHQSLTAVDA